MPVILPALRRSCGATRFRRYLDFGGHTADSISGFSGMSRGQLVCIRSWCMNEPQPGGERNAETFSFGGIEVACFVEIFCHLPSERSTGSCGAVSFQPLFSVFLSVVVRLLLGSVLLPHCPAGPAISFSINRREKIPNTSSRECGFLLETAIWRYQHVDHSHGQVSPGRPFQWGRLRRSLAVVAGKSKRSTKDSASQREVKH